jgi:hypothetical protein
MRRQKLYGVMRADFLVVLALAVFLLTLAGPLASKPRAQASRVVCRANLGRIGKAMLVYAGDYDGALPRAGGPTTTWGCLGINWAAPDRHTAYGVTPDTNEGGRASISSCFYLLVKYLEMPTKVFVCPSDQGSTPFALTDEESVPRSDFQFIDAWDFGNCPFNKCSYTYHIPFSQYALTTTRDPNLAVAADRSPWIAGPAYDVDTESWAVFMPDIPPYNGTVHQARQGNAWSHEKDGQNVLFLDGRAVFERRSHCGVVDDNIYTRSTMSSRSDPLGTMPSTGSWFRPTNESDSLLVHDPPVFGTTRR